MGWRTTVAVLGLLALVATAACGDDDSGGQQGSATTEPAASSTTVEDRVRPAGSAAALSGPLTAGRGVDLAGSRPMPLPDGWVEEEYVAAGMASSYRAAGELPADGAFDLVEDRSAPYRTRILVRRPAGAEAFSGTVVVEWLNVSGGVDSAPDFAYLAEEILRRGHAWVGVSAQVIGVEGGPAAVGLPGAEPSPGIKASDPERYGDLAHPGDAYAYDIYTQVARALRTGASGVLGELEPEVLLAVGESQSAFALTTYVNGVQPITEAFDGFLVHSRAAGPAPLGEPGQPIDLVQALFQAPARIRTDGEAPVLVLQTETDVVGYLGYHAARQPDDERFRLWEVAGTAHADQHLLGPTADLLDCGGPINAGPHHLVAKAALWHLDRWVRGGEAPPEAPRLELAEVDGGVAIARDGDGNALGGIRTPHVDAPVAALSGDPRPDASVMCSLMGQTNPLPTERLRELHGDRAGYSAAFEAAADAVVQAGFVLPDDRDAMLAEAQPDALPG